LDDIDEKAESVEIPRHVSREMRRWIEDVLSGWDFAPEDVTVAITAAEARDEDERARKILCTKGSTFVDRLGNPRLRPENAVARDSRVAFLRAVRQLKESVQAWLDAEAEAEEEQSRRPYNNNFRRTPEWVHALREKEASAAPSRSSAQKDVLGEVPK
jgi:hypothetical protein